MYTEEDIKRLEQADRRTKDYKDYQEWLKTQNIGAGDIVESITEATGIKAIVKKMFGEDCGCDERKQALNKILPLRVVNCVEEADFEYMAKFFEKNTLRVTPEDQRKLLSIYNTTFGQDRKASGCSACVRTIVSRLKQLYDAYKKDQENTN
jgi:NAD(P)H-nitrite reductase large subunit